MSDATEAIALERTLWEARAEIARQIVDRSGRELGDEARARWRGDLQSHLEHLAVAVGRRASRLFDDYVRWAKRVEVARAGSATVLDAQLEALAEHLRRTRGGPALALVESARRALVAPEQSVSPLPASGPYATLTRHYLACVLAKRRHEAVALIREAADSGTPVRDLYLEVLAPVQAEAGRLWDQNLITVADEHYCTAATQLAIAQLYEHMFSAPRLGRTVIASAASGELHELGIRMVSDLLELEGWDAIYFGASVPREAVFAAAREQPPDLIAVSATLPQGIRDVAQLIEALRADPLTRAIPVLVGGHAFSAEPRLYSSIGADATAQDAREAIEAARRLVER